MLGRGTLGRWAAAKTSARDLPQLARFLHQTLTARNASNMPAARALARAYRGVLGARRSYATTTAATKPTATVKKAVKAKAAAKAAPKKTAAATKTVKKPAKKPVKKMTAAKAKAKPKAAPKPKKKAAVKKPAPKKRVKKALTPEQKEKIKIRELRLKALKEPVVPKALTARNVYVGEKLRGTGENASHKLADVGKAFTALTPAELEHYNHLANQQTAARMAEYKAWILTHTPEQIYAANVARNQLRYRLKAGEYRGTPRYTARLRDDRLPKRPSGTYTIFVSERWASGDMKGIAAPDASRIIASEWKALSAGEKKKYQDQYEAEKAKFNRANATAA